MMEALLDRHDRRLPFLAIHPNGGLYRRCRSWELAQMSAVLHHCPNIDPDDPAAVDMAWSDAQEAGWSIRSDPAVEEPDGGAA